MVRHADVSTFFAERGFGNRIGFGERPAVLVIDMINAFTDPSMPLGAAMDSEIEAACTLLTAARHSRVPVFFTAVAYERPSLDDAGIWALKQSGIVTLQAGTPAVDIDRRLERRQDEPLIVKTQASAFFGTDLIGRLTTRHVDTLLVAGCTTSGCVRATAVDGCAFGFRTMIVREAVGDRAEAAHLQSLFDLDQKYADVVGLDAAMACLAGISGQR